MTVVIRIGLAILFLDELVVGAWNAISPETFYRYFPTVDLTPPFSEHYARDFGGASLGIALLLGIAFFVPKAHFVIPAALAYSIFSVPHFFFHLAHLEGTTGGEAIALTAANAIVALIGVAVIVLTILRDRRAPRQEATEDVTHPHRRCGQ
ncbi:hypothetical protein ET475_00225 [Microbacterium protaetiae]|uniref:DUF4345 domain-containing protein n=1 Tax=Microbacterium protaetiae TaxID=2509458 RepID=A0A4P6EBD3_9MICO|nr:hypothetical protein [Microbacterium protaetiae]QAY58583.1 hypothetical protein ET475_00225 [Microbacterium protaetiae]